MLGSPCRRTTTGITSAAGLLGVAAVAYAALARARPHLTGPPPAWTGADLAFAATWLIATVCAAWLALTTIACLLAMVRGDVGLAARIASCAPPVARGVLRAALVGSIVLTPTAAHAGNQPAPFTLHVGAGGRITETPAPPSTAPPDEVPVVRAPPSTSVPAAPTTNPPRTTPSTTTTSPTTPIAARPRAAAAAKPLPKPVAVATGRAHVVRAGDNLWRIAEAEIMRRHAGTASEADVVRYWQHVITANRTTLRSGDPSLIFPGEIVTLPLD